MDSIGSVLDRLDAQASYDALARDAAHVIRRLTEQLSDMDRDLTEAEFSRYAHAVELDRIMDRRRNWEQRRNQKAAKR